MSLQHHSEGTPEMPENVRKLFEREAESRQRFIEQCEARANRTWSDGRLGGNDDGDLSFAIGPHPNGELVCVDFGKQVTQIAMPPQQAVELAQALIKFARAMSKEPIVIQLH